MADTPVLPPRAMRSPSIFANRTATNAAWAALLLKDVGAKVTPNNVQNVMRWMSAENPPKNWANRNNPLNASLNTNAEDGTGAYSDLTTGAHNTANMIVAGYKGGAIGDTIYNALMNDVPPDQFSVAVVDSNWSSNHYGVASAGSDKAAPGRLASYFQSIPVPAVISADNANSGSGTVSPANPGEIKGSNGVKSTGCSGKGDIMHFDGLLGVGKWKITACQGKAMIAGFGVIAGAVILLVGANLLAKDTAAGVMIPEIIQGIKG